MFQQSTEAAYSELAATTSAGSVFQMCGAATAKTLLPTVDSLTGGRPTTRHWKNGVFVAGNH